MDYISKTLREQFVIYIAVTSAYHVTTCRTFVAWELIGRVVKDYRDKVLPSWMPLPWLEIFLPFNNLRQKRTANGRIEHARRLDRPTYLPRLIPTDEWKPFKGAEVRLNKVLGGRIVAFAGRADWLEGEGCYGDGAEITKIYDLKFCQTTKGYKQTDAFTKATLQISIYAFILRELGLDVDEVKGAVIACEKWSDCLPLKGACINCSKARKIPVEVNVYDAEEVAKELVLTFRKGLGAAIARGGYDKDNPLCQKCEHRGGCQMTFSNEKLADIEEGWIRWRWRFRSPRALRGLDARLRNIRGESSSLRSKNGYLLVEKKKKFPGPVRGLAMLRIQREQDLKRTTKKIIANKGTFKVVPRC